MRRYSLSSEKHFILILSIIFLVLTFFVVKDIFALIIYSMILSYFLVPLFNYYQSKFHNKRISSLLTLVSATIGLFLPIVFLFYFMILSLLKLIIDYKFYLENPEILNETISHFLGLFTDSTSITTIDFSEFIKTFVNYMIDFSNNFLFLIPEMIIYFFIVLFISYYILVHSESMFRAINEYIPMNLRKQNEILRNITRNLKVLFRGYFLTGLIQTLVAAVVYLIFGAPNFLILTFLTFITSIIPYVGTPIVWVPLGVYMIITGNDISGFGILICGAIFISTIDNFLRPILMSDSDTVPPPLVFIGFVGGMFAFGIEGIILGPIVISITAILLKYLKEFYELKDRAD